jgi:hypothetical protein
MVASSVFVETNTPPPGPAIRFDLSDDSSSSGDSEDLPPTVRGAPSVEIPGFLGHPTHDPVGASTAPELPVFPHGAPVPTALSVGRFSNGPGVSPSVTPSSTTLGRGRRQRNPGMRFNPDVSNRHVQFGLLNGERAHDLERVAARTNAAVKSHPPSLPTPPATPAQYPHGRLATRPVGAFWKMHARRSVATTDAFREGTAYLFGGDDGSLRIEVTGPAATLLGATMTTRRYTTLVGNQIVCESLPCASPRLVTVSPRMARIRHNAHLAAVSQAADMLRRSARTSDPALGKGDIVHLAAVEQTRYGSTRSRAQCLVLGPPGGSGCYQLACRAGRLQGTFPRRRLLHTTSLNAASCGITIPPASSRAVTLDDALAQMQGRDRAPCNCTKMDCKTNRNCRCYERGYCVAECHQAHRGLSNSLCTLCGSSGGD